MTTGSVLGNLSAAELCDMIRSASDDALRTGVVSLVPNVPDVPVTIAFAGIANLQFHAPKTLMGTLY